MEPDAWGFPMQGRDQLKEIDEMGSWLSLAINCPVRYPAYDKGIFECRCGITFMKHMIVARDDIIGKSRHREGKGVTDGSM